MKKLLVILVITFMLFSGIQRVLAVDIPSTPIPVSPVNGASVESIAPIQVSLLWGVVPGATYYNVAMSTIADYSLPFFSATTAGGNQQVTPYLNYGVTYYWKVQAGNSGGISSWSANQTLTLVPKSPVILSPLNGTNVILGNSIYLKWQFVSYSGGTGYTVEVAREPTFSVPTTTIGIITTDGFNFTPTTIGNYYWRVKVLLPNPSVASPWSEVRYFNVSLPPLNEPNLVSPHYNELVMSNEVDLRWSAVPFASYYQIQTRGTNIDQVTYQSSYSLMIVSGQNYSWRVRAGNACGWGPWSSWNTFRCLLAPGVVNLTTPIDGDSLKKLGAVLSWQSIGNATSYKVQLTDASTGQTWNWNSTTNSLFVETQFNHWYSWKIAASNDAGQGLWSTIWHFSVPDTTPPVISITEWKDWTNQNSMSLYGKVTDTESGVDRVVVNGVSVALNTQGEFSYVLSLSEGMNVVTIAAYDKAGNMSSKQTETRKDTTSPAITITRPLGIKSTVVDDIAIEGKVVDAGGMKTFIINNNSVTVDRNGDFSYPVTLNYGPNQVYVSATDLAGNQTRVMLNVIKVERTITFSFQIGNPKMESTQIAFDGQPRTVFEEIDPGRGTSPLVRNDRVFIPVRKFVEILGGDVFWDKKSQKITIKIPGQDPLQPAPGRQIQMELWIGKPVARITDYNGSSHYVQIETSNVKVTPFIQNDRSYFPLRFIVENFGLASDHVQWCSELQTVRISYPLVP